MTANATLCLATVEFLSKHAPFDNMKAEDLTFIAERLALAYYPEGHIVLEPEMGAPAYFYIVQRGAIRVDGATSGPTQDTHALLEEGECFPIGAASGDRPTVNRYTAAEDTFCYQLASADFHQLLQQSSEFNRFCTAYLATLLGQTHLNMQQSFQQKALEQQGMAASLSRLIRREPITCAPDTSLAEAFTAMHAARAGSMVITEAGVPIGILTQSDLLPRVLLPNTPLDTPISQVMTHAPFTLSEHATAYDATLAMATRGIRHVLAVDGAGRLRGVISERDLFAMQRVGLRELRQRIEHASDLASLVQAGQDLQQLSYNLLAQGLGPEQLTQFVSAMNDCIVRQVIALTLPKHDLHDVQWCWLAFGSEGREEQTFSTDQDNGLVYLSERPEEEVKPNLLAFAAEVVAGLDQCGFPLCQGHIMASNPDLTLSLNAWQRKFSHWISSPDPKALLAATIFFDLRPLAGEESLAQRLTKYLLHHVSSNTMFQHMLAGNALSSHVPLGLVRDFVTETHQGQSGWLDLKKSGARLFVDAARVLALAHGVAATNTLSRLEQTAPKSGIHPDVLHAILDAFRFIQLLRLRLQQEPNTDKSRANLLRVDELNPLERRMLKESLQQARRLQSHLKTRYSL